MQVLYDIVFTLFAIGYLPAFLARLKQAEDPKRLLRERRGEIALSAPEPGRPRIWLHAVSVGEVKAMETFYRLLEARGFEVVLSTVTPTGQREAGKLAGRKTFYFPFDLSFAVRRALQAVRPDLILLAETELWPNFIREASRRNIPLGVVNGRLSQRSFNRYLWIDFLMKDILERPAFFFMQTEKDAARLIQLGAGAEHVEVLGNMKFDTPVPKDPAPPERLRRTLGIEPGRKVWIAGSTHAGEEVKALAVFTRLRAVFHDLVLVLAPRHIERASEVETAARNFNFRTARFSKLEPSGGRYDVLVLDTIGELRKIYQVADVVWMGGSFIPHGGQNPIEPALYAKPVLTGRHVANFEFVYGELEKNQAAVIVPAEDELFVWLKEFLASPARSREYGARAFETVTRLAGASEKTAERIGRFLAEPPCGASVKTS